MTPIAIVGIGCHFPRARGTRAYWSNVKAGVDAITEVPPSHWRLDEYYDSDAARPDMTYGRRGGFLDPTPFDTLAFGVSPKNLPATDTTQLFGLLAARDALRDAGYATAPDAEDGRAFDRMRASVILGVTGALELVIPLGARLGHPIWRRALAAEGVDTHTADEIVRRISEGYVDWQENSFPGLLGNVAAGRIANRFDLGGTNCVVDAACASSLGAVHLAMMELESGRTDMALSGGVDTFNDIFMYMCFSKTPALSPSGDSRPFSHDGDGTILGEGVGVLVLKRLADAERDGDRVRAVIRGVGSSSDGRGNAIYAPSAAGQQRALRSAYAQAELSPATVELFEAHGTGTRVGDAAEVEALTRVFRDERADGTWCALGSVKSMIGHTKAAAGVAGLIKAALALEHKVLPPTLKVEQPLESLRPDAADPAPVYLNLRARPWIPRREHPRRAGVSAFGFGGSNFHCVLEEHRAAKAQADFSGRCTIVAFSAPDATALSACVGAFVEGISSAEPPARWARTLAAAQAARAAFDPGDAHRLVAVLEPVDVEGDSALSALEANRGEPATSAPEGREAIVGSGVRIGAGRPAGRLAVLFPGQGAQRPDMLLDLACLAPELLDVLAAADRAFDEDEPGRRLSDVLYPTPAFDDAGRAAQRERLQDTRRAQPAIGAVSLGAWSFLAGFGVRADAYAGHSFGELTALAAAGRITTQAMLSLAVTRGRLMATPPDADPVTTDRGAMLAVAAAPDTMQAWVEGSGLEVVLANRNGPRQSVLSGTSEAIATAGERLAGEGCTVARLPVSGAFHSPLMAGAAAPFATALSEIEFVPATGGVDVYANLTAEPYPAEPAAARDLLARQLLEPVRFAELVENMYSAGVRTFVEVGPGRVLGGLVAAILADRPANVLSLDGRRGPHGERAAADLLAALAALGYPLDLTRWDPLTRLDGDDRAGPATVSITGANVTGPIMRPRAAAASTAALEAPTRREPARAGEAPVLDAASRDGATSAAPGREPPAAGAEALRITQDAIRALAEMQAQTAALHQQYLSGLEATQRSIHTLLAQIAGGTAGTGEGESGREAPAPAALDAATQFPATMRATGPASPEAHTAPALARSDADDGGPPDALLSEILAIVAEKTGYPSDMLRPEMALDADLGIDSIKRVEILSAVHERVPGMDEPTPDRLAEIRTLADIAGLLAVRRAAAPGVPETAAPIAANQSDRAERQVLEIIAEKTGYPPGMLSLEMQLDADLGIDSIKRVEILAALEERIPGAAPPDADALASIATLADVIAFASRGAGIDTDEPPARPTARRVGPSRDEALESLVLESIAQKTGYPLDVIGLDMHLETDLGIDSIKRVEILSALDEKLAGGFAADPQRLAELTTVRSVLGFLTDTSPAPSAPSTPTAAIESTAEPARLERTTPVLTPIPATPRVVRTLPRGAVVWVAAEPPLLAHLLEALAGQGLEGRAIRSESTVNGTPPSGLLIVSPLRPDAGYLERAFSLVRRAGPALRAAGGVLTAVCRLDGGFGFAGGRCVAPLGAGLAGIVKSAGYEWPEVACKVLDIAGSADGDTASEIVDEALLTGPVEVGITASGRRTVTLASLPLDGSCTPGGLPVGAGDVVVVTGGARGITAEIAVALARRTGCRPVLIGRSDVSTPEPAGLAGVVGEGPLKGVLRTLLGLETPARVEQAYRRLVAGREVRGTLERLEGLGCAPRYLSLDVRDREPLAEAIAEIRRELGPIRALVHGAGVIADRRIEEKSDDDVAAVLGTKVASARTLLAALPAEELRGICFLSSSSARFGRQGQADYAAANEVLNKLAQDAARERRGCRVVSINWGPWAGGMVSAGLARRFAAEGIGLIPLAGGAETLLALWSEPGPVEVVVLAAGAAEPSTPRRSESIVPLIAAHRHEVSVAQMPVLASHVLDGQAVVPLAISQEWLAQAAMHHHPGLSFHGIEDLRVLSALKLGADDCVTAEAAAAVTDEHDGWVRVATELRSPAGVHVRASVVLGVEPLQADPGSITGNGSGVSPPDPTGPGNGAAPAPHWRDVPLYDGRCLFHGPAMHGLERIERLDPSGAEAWVTTSPRPERWFATAPRSTWITDPLAIDAGFQLMVMWSLEASGLHSLPTHVGRYRQHVRRYPAGGVRATAAVTERGPHRIVADIVYRDADGGLVAEISGYECVVDASLADAFAHRTLSGDGPRPAAGALGGPETPPAPPPGSASARAAR